MEALEVGILAPDANETTAGVEKKRRGRRLRSAQNVRAALAHLAREVEAETSMDLAEKGRLLANLYTSLLRAIEAVDHAARRDERLAELERAFEQLAGDRGVSVS